jgi:hypothetical protein
MCSMYLETTTWNNYSISLEFYVSRHVRPTLLCNLCMVGMFGLYNTLTTLRTHHGTMFMLIILPNCASKWWLTMYGPWNTFIWSFQKCDLTTLYGCAPCSKVVENFIRNKSCKGDKSWKGSQHVQKCLTTQKFPAVSHPENFEVLGSNFSFMYLTLELYILQHKLIQTLIL